MDTTTKHRRFIWLVGIALAIYFLAPSIIGFVWRVLYSRPQPPVKTVQLPKGASQPKAIKTASTVPAASVTVPSAAAATNSASVSVADADTFANFFGNWQGRAALSRHRVCTLKFELRENHAAERPYAGYSNLTCTPVWPFELARRKTDAATILTAGLSPMSAILTGAPQNGSIQFHVDKTLGDNCPMTALTLMPFGIKQIAVQWQDTFCGGGYMVLSKVR